MSKPESNSNEIFTRVLRSIRNRKGRSVEVNDDNPENYAASSISTSPTPVLLHANGSFDLTKHGSSNTKPRFSLTERLKNIGKDISKLGNVSTRNSSDPVPYHPSTPELNNTKSYPIAGPSRIPADVQSNFPENNGASPSRNEQRLSDTDEFSGSLSLAHRIQRLVSSLPLPGHAVPGVQPESSFQNRSTGPVPPDDTKFDDPRLLGLLSNTSVMNGEGGRDNVSVWSALESMGSPKRSSLDTIRNEGGSENGPSEQYSDVFSDNSSVMMYSPLFPSQNDLVELAETVPSAPEEKPEDTEPSWKNSWTSMWPLASWYTKVNQQDQNSRPSEDISVSNPANDEPDRTPRIVESHTVGDITVPLQIQRSWVPSKTKLSVQVMWWGYRLYLPPPILEVLDDRQLEATRRAAMITTALTWFFSNLPISALPPVIQPAVLLIQRLAPFLGYIGTFISWSWGTIKSYDIGYGVILTATWLLPVALIPGTWYENEFPKSPVPPSLPLPVDTNLRSPPTSYRTVASPVASTFGLTPAHSDTPLPIGLLSISPSHLTMSPVTPSFMAVTHGFVMQSPSTPVPHNFYPLPQPQPQSPSPSSITSPTLTFRTAPSTPLQSSSPIPPVASQPIELLPVPPPVPPGSPLVSQLLRGPILYNIPLPDVEEEMTTKRSQ